MAEQYAVDKWLYTMLSSDAALMSLATGVYTFPVPTTAVLPYVVYQDQPAIDIQGVGAARIGITGLWLVRGVARATSWGGTLDQIATRLDEVLQAASGSNVDGEIWACVRERPFRLIEPVTTGQYRHAGGQYRIWAT
jgi:hypothetical protein